MSNKGLSKNAANIGFDLSGLKGYVNITRELNDLIVPIPLFTTIGDNPFSLSLIYRLNESGSSNFGSGFIPSISKSFETVNNRISVTNADSSVDHYFLYDTNKYKNADTRNIIELTNDEIIIEDKTNNKIIYSREDSEYYGYPKSIITEKGTITINRYNNNPNFLEIIEGNSKITFNKPGFYTQYAVYTYCNMDLMKIYFEYTDYVITRIKVKTLVSGGEYLTKDYSIIRNNTTNTLKIKDNILNKTSTIGLGSNLITSISMHDTINPYTLNYYQDKTTISDLYDNSVTYSYDLVNRIIVEDDRSSLISRVYHHYYNDVISETSVTKLMLNGTKTPINTSGVIDSTLPENFLRYYIDYDEEQDVTINNYLEGTPLTLSGYFKGTSMVVRFMGHDFTINGNPNYYVFYSVGGRYNSNTVTFGTFDSGVYLSSVVISKNDSFSYYNYDTDRRLISSNDSEGTTSYTYSNNGTDNVTLVVDHGLSTNYTYEMVNNKETEFKHSETNNGVTTTYRYDNYFNVIEEETVFNARTLIKRNAYYNHRISYSSDVNNNLVIYDYNDDGTVYQERIRRNDDENSTKEYEYNQYRQVIELEHSVLTNHINYDNQTRLESSYIQGGNNYSITRYNTTNVNNYKLHEVKLNNKLIEGYEYDSLGREVKKYYSSTAYNTVTYDEKNRIGTVNGSAINYDDYDRIRSFDGIIYTYDERNRVTGLSRNDFSIDYKYDDVTSDCKIKYNKAANHKYKIENDGSKYRRYRQTGNLITETEYIELNGSGKFIPLNGTYLSVENEYPVECNVNQSNFTYDNGYGYNVSSNKKLVYSMGNSSTFTVSIDVNTLYPRSKSIIFEIYKSGKRFQIYDNYSNLYYSYNGEAHSLGISTSYSTWKRLIVGFQKTSSTLNIKVKYNTTEKTITLGNIDLSTSNIILGNESVVGSSGYYMGKLKNLCIINSYTTNPYTSNKKVNTFNNINELIKEKILYNDNTVYEKNYTLTNEGMITAESLTYGGNTNNRTYVNDSVGNVKGISDSLFGSKQYRYDTLNRIILEDGYSYIYDGNNNITNKRGLTLSYTDGLLTGIGGTSVVYSTNMKLYPIEYRDHRFTYNKNRISEINNRYSGQPYVTNVYNQRGLRTRKNNTYYHYEGDKLVYEETGSTLIEYLYENDSLYGFKYNGSIYFYIRDKVGTILGIIDSSSNIVVKYNYTAYGEVTISGSNISLGNLNPFRYKGYYYDKEVGYYYCISRYYDPYTGRWITPDSFKYINSNSVLEMNLYAYCNNNPVMYSDGSGHFPILALLIGIGIGALIGGAGAGVSSYKDGNRGKALIGDILGGALVGGALGAASTLGGLAGAGYIGLKAAAISLGVSSLASFGAGVGSYALEHTWGRNEEWNPQAAFTKGAVVAVEGYVNFVLGAAFAQTGIWNSLNKGQFGSNYSFLRSGLGPVKSLGGATAMYLAENAGQMAARFAIKTAMTFPWIYLNKYL